MGIPTPFHDKIAPLCKSMAWKEWSGYYSVQRYDISVDPEYFAFRETAGLLDITPLFKYDIRGPQAGLLADRVLTRDAGKIQDGQVAYCCWCDEEGKVIDDGTVFRYNPEHYRITSANPSYLWLSENADGLDVTVEDVSHIVAAVALQGPNSRTILKNCSDADLDSLKFFRFTEAKLDGFRATISRTGYTGDLGYEIWTDPANAGKLWDVLTDAGHDYGLRPAGLLALDMTRIEAGFVLIDVDFKSSVHCLTDEQKSSPYEIGLGWTVHLDKPVPCVGRDALARERRKGSKWKLVGLEVDFPELEAMFHARRVPVSLPCHAWREVVPLYTGRARHHQAGYATSGVWSPLLKRYIALATVPSRYAATGTELYMDTMVEYDREAVKVRVVDKPFFDPPRKKATA